MSSNLEAPEGLVCLCGVENFERVVVSRPLPAGPFVTDFVACVGCRSMYWVPATRDAIAEFNFDKHYAHIVKRKPGEKG
jgi:hypothetical protein